VGNCSLGVECSGEGSGVRRRDASFNAFSSVRRIDTFTHTYSLSVGMIMRGCAMIVKRIVATVCVMSWREYPKTRGNFSDS